MKSMKMNFYILFTGLGLLVSLGMGLLMYIQYHNYIRASYFDTLTRVAKTVEAQYPVLHDTAKLKQGAAEDADWFWESSRGLTRIAAAFDLAYIYYIEKTEGGYVFLMSSSISKENHPEWLGGPVWAENTPIPEGMDEAYETQRMTLSRAPTVNEWGSLVSVKLPIVTGGKTVGLLGAAYDISFVRALERSALIILTLSFTASAAIVGLLAFAGSRSVVVPLQESERLAREAVERGQKIEQLAEALKAASTAKSTFLAGISHEMRTPLNAIIGLSTIMLGEKNIPQKIQENLELVNDSGMMLLGVVNDILDINKIEAGKFEIIPVLYELPDLINEIAVLNTMYAGDRPVRFELLIDEALPCKLFGDEMRIKQICNKILSNAFKYTQEGSVTLEVSSEREGGYVWLTLNIRDTGTGIRAEDMEKLFSEYGQPGINTKRRAGGTGLGLVIAKRMAEMMDGTLTAESEYGKGCAFTLRVRQKFVSEDRIEPEVAENLRNFRHFSSRRDWNQRMARIRIPHARALLVDDIPVNLMVARGIMQPYQMQIDSVSSGREAVERVRRAEVKYDIIFMDYMMPEMDGIEATRIIREEIGTMYAKTVPIVALTASEVEGNGNIFLQNGFNAFLSKPIDIVQLDKEINRWVRGVEPVELPGEAFI